MPTPPILNDPAEQERLKRHDAKLLTSVRRMTGDEVVSETFSINDKRERELLVEITEDMEVVEDGDPIEKASKGLTLEVVAERTYGSRDSYYTSRVKGAMMCDGVVNQMLSNGAVVDVQDGFVIKTRAIADFEDFAQRVATKTVDGTVRTAAKNIARLNDFLALLERRNPDVKEITATERTRAFNDLSTQVPSRIKALEPAKKPKR